jgi:hypothetical protein
MPVRRQLVQLTWPATKPYASAALAASIGGRATGQFLKHGRIPVLVADLISLEHDASLELPVGIVFRKVDILFDANRKDASNMYSVPCVARLGRDDGPFANPRLVPTSNAAQAIPFLLQGGLRLGVGRLFLFANRAGHTRNEWKLVG